MTRFMKMCMLLNVFEDVYSRILIMREWLSNDPILDLRFALAFRMEDF